MRCSICGIIGSTTTKIKEPRYFEGSKGVCGDCFRLWCDNNMDALDKKAIEKILPKEKKDENKT